MSISEFPLYHWHPIHFYKCQPNFKFRYLNRLWHVIQSVKWFIFNSTWLLLFNYQIWVIWLGVKITRSKIGPDWGLARTEPGHFGPVLGPRNFHIRSSVRSRSGPVDRIKWVARSCPSTRADRAPQKKRVHRTKRGGTVVPLSTVWQCPQKKRWHGQPVPLFCLVHAQDRSGPGFARSGPRSVPLPLFGLRSRPVRCGPIWSWTELHP